MEPGKADELEAYLAELPTGEQSPFARLEMLHIARVQLFRALVHQGPKQKHTDTLQNAHLVFTSTIDGDLDPYLDALAERVPEADEWWGRCAGYPGRADAASLPRVGAQQAGRHRACSSRRSRTRRSATCARRWRCASA